MKLFKLTITAIIAVILTLSYSCLQESVIEQDYSDMPYISLPEGTDFDNLSMSEIEIIIGAYMRMGIYEDEDGLLQLKPHSGWEVNVSENLYQYVISILKKKNDDITSGITISHSNILSRAEGPNGSATDCLA